ncbi:MAG: hypothetical protein ACR2JJ_03260 [Sphingomicrobium sp.]
MQRANLKPDSIDQLSRKFEQRVLPQPLFLNSLPKSGSHLLRNIIRMFVPVAQQYKRQFIQHAIFDEHRVAFQKQMPLLSWGHLLFSDKAAVELTGVRKILLVRDPYTWVLSCARFLISDEFSGLDELKEEQVTAEQLVNLVIFGIWQKLPSLSEQYTHNVVAWLGTGVHLVRFESLVQAVRDLETPKSEHFFTELLEACGIERPEDWRERVRVGADPAESGTSAENIRIRKDIPSTLPDLHRRMVDYAAPGLRSLLGYEGGEIQ